LADPITNNWYCDKAAVFEAFLSNVDVFLLFYAYSALCSVVLLWCDMSLYREQSVSCLILI